MLYTVDAYDDEPIMLINDEIGYPGINGSLFQQELMQLDGMGKKRIQVWINSIGGSVMDGYSIYSAILKSKTPVDTMCVGMAASIAGVLFQAGRKRIMCDYGVLMYHNPYGGDDKVIGAMTDSLNTMIANRCKMTSEEVQKMMNRTTFINADEALSMSLCDEIESSVTANVKWKKDTTAVNYARECAKIVNSLIPQKITSMIKVTARLNLNDAAKEEDVVAEINKIENRAIKAEGDLSTATTQATAANQAHATELTAVQAKLTTETAAKDKLTADLKSVQDKLTAMETDKKNAEKATAKLAAETMVTGFAKAGRIKNDATTILKWVTLTETMPFDEVKSMIEDLPLNKVAPVITGEAVKLKEGELPTSAMGLAVKAKLKREGRAA